MKIHLKNILYRGIQSKRGVRTLEDGIAREEPREAVSYTHLTLPTILLV